MSYPAGTVMSGNTFYGIGQQQNAMNQMMGAMNSYCHLGAPAHASFQQSPNNPTVQAKVPQPQETKVKDDILPDISLTRVFKWAIVLLLALGLGKRVWSTFGPKIEAQLHKALELK